MDFYYWPAGIYSIPYRVNLGSLSYSHLIRCIPISYPYYPYFFFLYILVIILSIY
jgi:hypothetical protein